MRSLLARLNGLEGITVAVRIGFDDNRSLGAQETGGRVALPVFKELMLRVYREKLVGPAPEFPAQMEQNINDYLTGDSIANGESLTGLNPSNPLPLATNVACNMVHGCGQAVERAGEKTQEAAGAVKKKL